MLFKTNPDAIACAIIGAFQYAASPLPLYVRYCEPLRKLVKIIYEKF